MTEYNIELKIEQLVLHGFAPGDRHRIGAAIQQELARLLAEQGIPPGIVQGKTIEQFDGGAFEIKAGTPLRVIGAQIAQAIYGGLQYESADAIAGQPASQDIVYPSAVESPPT
jgi:hypothetical protein